MATITINDILTTYWSQVTLILFGLGFLLKSIIDLRSKKTEINHSLFQQNRLSSVNTFFTNYAKTEAMWNSISVFDVLEKNMDAKDIDDFIFPNLYELRRNVLELNIYFDEDKLKNFLDLYHNMNRIQSKLGEMFFYNKKDKNVVQKSSEFKLFRDQIFKENEIIYKKISTQLQNTFK